MFCLKNSFLFKLTISFNISFLIKHNNNKKSIKHINFYTNTNNNIF